MVMAMGRIRGDLLSIVRSLEADPDAEDGIARLCDVELAVMLETYHAAYGEDLSRRERLAAIGQIAASVSHEIKNPLAVIGSSAYALELVCAKISGHLEPAHAKRVRTHLGRIRRNTERAGTIVTTLLEFLRDRKPVLTLVPWEQVVREGVRDADVPHHVEIELGDDPGAGSVLVDRAQIARVVGNLTRNAVEAMPNEGFIRIDLHADATEVGVSVTDEGPGFSGEILPRAFEPLHTTKAVGTGLGLALCRAIVEAHGGTIEARNLDSRGACVTFRIPRRSAFPA
ncbi:MAG: sensor histidine kinase, partial [Planctomycetota bacterium]|jgi:signal transduction histidine kinase